MSELNNQTLTAIDKALEIVSKVFADHQMTETILEDKIYDSIERLKEDESLKNDTPLLTEEEQDILNWYLEDGDIMCAMGNSDFWDIYKKLVGNNRSKKYCSEEGRPKILESSN